MNKKREIMFVGFMIVLFSFFHLFFEFGYQVPERFHNDLLTRFLFLSILIPPIFLSIIAILEKRRRKTVLKTSKNSNILLNFLTNSFFLLINSLLILNTMFLSPYYNFPKVLFFVLPLFTGFNILWVITTLKSFQNGQKIASISDKSSIMKKTPLNAILIVVEVLLLIANLMSVFYDFSTESLAIYIPTLILFDISWIILISKWTNGGERNRIILKITLSLFGFNLFWNILGFRFRPFFVTNIPLTISGIIYIVLRLRNIKKMNSVNSDIFEINNEDLMDKHSDLLRIVYNYMNKKMGFVFVGLMIFLYTLTFQYYFNPLFAFPEGFHFDPVYFFPNNMFLFLSTLFTSMFCLNIARVAIKRKKKVLKISENSNLLYMPLNEPFFLLVNSFFIIGTIIVSIDYFSGVILLILPFFAGFNILWVITKLKSFRDGQKYTSISDNVDIKKKDPINIILIIVEALLLTIVSIFALYNFQIGFLMIFIPTLVLFDIFWIILISKRKNGVERDRLILKIILSLFGFNLFWNIIGVGYLPVFIICIPLTLTGIIFIVLHLWKIKKINFVNSNSFESNHEDLMDEHLDLIRKLNGNQ